jgi:predicted GIY-YIG superfamily endonuclease
VRHDHLQPLPLRYDADDRLLYIGVTRDVNARMMVHRSNRTNPTSVFLTVQMTRYEVEPLGDIDREAAFALEREAIGAEAPALNVLHNKGRTDRSWPERKGDSSLMRELDGLFTR